MSSDICLFTTESRPAVGEKKNSVTNKIINHTHSIILFNSLYKNMVSSFYITPIFAPYVLKSKNSTTEWIKSWKEQSLKSTMTHNLCLRHFNFNDSTANVFVVKMTVGKISTTEYTMNQTSF